MEIEKWDADFKNLVLASNPELYQALFSDDLSTTDEEQLEYQRPESPAEFQSMMAELRESGLLQE